MRYLFQGNGAGIQKTGGGSAASLNDKRIRNFVETHFKVANGCFEMREVFEAEVLKALPYSYDSTLKRVLFLPRKAAKNSELKQTLLDTFAELLREEWLVAVRSDLLDAHAWYLPFLLLNLLNQEWFMTVR